MKTILFLFLFLSPLVLYCSQDEEVLNIKFMLRGYCFAASKPHKSDPGGFGASSNQPIEFPAYYKKKSNTAELIAYPNKHKSFFKKYKGFVLLLTNPTPKELQFEASDSRLSIVMQAKNKEGKWVNIEYLPSSWCGNSYHTLTLPINKAWSFIVPQYTGQFKTTLRFKFKNIYSNEFKGSINEEQFTVKKRYTPQSIMDPYLK